MSQELSLTSSPSGLEIQASGESSRMLAMFEQTEQVREVAERTAEQYLRQAIIPMEKYAPKDEEVLQSAMFMGQDVVPSTKEFAAFRAQMIKQRTATAMILGAKLGIQPYMVHRNIAMVHGVPSVFGPYVQGWISNHPRVERVEYKEEGSVFNNPPDMKVSLTIHWKTGGSNTEVFSFEEAVLSGNMPIYQDAGGFFIKNKYGKNDYNSPWAKHPSKMFRQKVAHKVVNAYFGDVFGSVMIHSQEDASDVIDTNFEDVTPTAPSKSLESKLEAAQRLVESKAAAAPAFSQEMQDHLDYASSVDPDNLDAMREWVAKSESADFQAVKEVSSVAQLRAFNKVMKSVNAAIAQAEANNVEEAPAPPVQPKKEEVVEAIEEEVDMNDEEAKKAHALRIVNNIELTSQRDIFKKVKDERRMDFYSKMKLIDPSIKPIQGFPYEQYA